MRGSGDESWLLIPHFFRNDLVAVTEKRKKKKRKKKTDLRWWWIWCYMFDESSRNSVPHDFQQFLSGKILPKSRRMFFFSFFFAFFCSYLPSIHVCFYNEEFEGSKIVITWLPDNGAGNGLKISISRGLCDLQEFDWKSKTKNEPKWTL